ncbi:acylphosphatase [Chloroflexota bacterium]
MADLVSLRVVVHGRVQGVYFRDFTSQHAAELGLTGYVRNLHDWNTVEIQAEGERSNLEKLIDYLKAGPTAAKVERVVTDWSEYTGTYSGFNIRH